MAISVIAAVRERIDLLHTMLESLYKTAYQGDQVEVILRCDFDDVEMIRYLSQRGREKFIVGPRMSGYASLPVFTNEAARLSKGDLVLVVNDDAEFVTPGWDVMLAKIAAQYPDGLFVIGVETANAKNFVFPCVSRKQINLMGCLFEERIVYPDIWLRDVMAPFNRAIRAYDVKVAHHWKGRSADQEQAMGVAMSQAHQNLYAKCVREGQEKVAAVLGVPA